MLDLLYTLSPSIAVLASMIGMGGEDYWGHIEYHQTHFCLLLLHYSLPSVVRYKPTYIISLYRKSSLLGILDLVRSFHQ